MKKLLALILVIPPLAVAGLYGYTLLTGPRMKVQPHVREFQMSLPSLPADAVAVSARARLGAAGQAAVARNPLPASAENLARGRIYYGYYCVFCHGAEGAGNGAVGESYMPRPADLRAPRVASASDPALLHAMLNGVGHVPVLERVVAPEHRWYLVLYVRSLAGRS